MNHMKGAVGCAAGAAPKKSVPCWHPQQALHGKRFYEIDRKEAATLLLSARKDRIVSIMTDVHGVSWYVCTGGEPGNRNMGRLYVPRSTRKAA